MYWEIRWCSLTILLPHKPTWKVTEIVHRIIHNWLFIEVTQTKIKTLALWLIEETMASPPQTSYYLFPKLSLPCLRDRTCSGEFPAWSSREPEFAESRLLQKRTFPFSLFQVVRLPLLEGTAWRVEGLHVSAHPSPLLHDKVRREEQAFLFLHTVPPTGQRSEATRDHQLMHECNPFRWGTRDDDLCCLI